MSPSPKLGAGIYKKNVIPTDIKPSDVSKESRIRDVFTELRSLDLAKYVNASALLLRTLIDLCVWNYLEKTGKSKDVLKHYQKKGNKKKDWAPTLGQSLTWLLENEDIGLRGPSLAALKRFTCDKNEALCLDTLHKFVHNSYTPPTASEMRSIWTTIDPLMRIILADPQ